MTNPLNKFSKLTTTD